MKKIKEGKMYVKLGELISVTEKYKHLINAQCDKWEEETLVPIPESKRYLMDIYIDISTDEMGYWKIKK